MSEKQPIIKEIDSRKRTRLGLALATILVGIGGHNLLTSESDDKNTNTTDFTNAPTEFYVVKVSPDFDGDKPFIIDNDEEPVRFSQITDEALEGKKALITLTRPDGEKIMIPVDPSRVYEVESENDTPDYIYLSEQREEYDRNCTPIFRHSKNDQFDFGDYLKHRGEPVTIA